MQSLKPLFAHLNCFPISDFRINAPAHFPEDVTDEVLRLDLHPDIVDACHLRKHRLQSLASRLCCAHGEFRSRSIQLREGSIVVIGGGLLQLVEQGASMFELFLCLLWQPSLDG